MNKKLTPDIEQARRHLRVLDKNSKVFTFQVFDDNPERKDPALAKTLRGTLEGLATPLNDYQKRGAGIFVTINETRGARRKKEDVKAYRAIWREADEPGLAPLPLAPHLIIESSPGHAHEYLIIEPSTELKRGDRIMQTMVDSHGSCPGAKDRARVLRLAGFYHLKNPDRPHLVRIIHEGGGQPYTIDQVAEAIPPVEAPGQAKPVPVKKTEYDSATGTPYGIKALEGECAEVAAAPEGTRNHRLNRAAFTCARLAAGGELNIQYARHEITSAAQRAGLLDTEIKQTIESGLRAGAKAPRKAPQKAGAPQAKKTKEIPPENPTTGTTIIPRRTTANHNAWVVVGGVPNASVVAQFAGDLVGVIVLRDCSEKPDAPAMGELARADIILVALDFDDAGAKFWPWWRAHFPRADRWPVPSGKDPGDYRKEGGDVRAWILAGLPPGLRPVSKEIIPDALKHSVQFGKKSNLPVSGEEEGGGQRGIEDAPAADPLPGYVVDDAPCAGCGKTLTQLWPEHARRPRATCASCLGENPWEKIFENLSKGV